VYDRARPNTPLKEFPMIRSARLSVSLIAAALLLAGCDKEPASTDAAASAPAAAAEAPAAADAFQNDAQRMGYALGANVGRTFREQKFPVDVDAVINGLRDAFTSGTMKMDDAKIAETLQQLQQTLQASAQAEQEASATRNVEEAKAFFAKNGTAEGVTTTSTGLQYQILTAADGKKPGKEDTVKVHYRGTLLDGTEFDSSYKRNEPIEFPLNAVIRGWTEGLQLIKPGGKIRLFIPSNLAYGPRGAGGLIGPDETLIFDVELLEVK
jgi:FKBP-type peptidyl-prolyl cis-trans isomerase FklB